MESSIKTINDSLNERLQQRKEGSLYRYLQVNDGLIDFCSNDYLSFARSEKMRQQVGRRMKP